MPDMLLDKNPDMPRKYLVISIDDGTTQDERVISLLKKYGIKATFNINTGVLDKREELPILCFDGAPLHHDIVTEKQLLNGLYAGFEVACHTRTHPMLTGLDEENLRREIIGNYDDIVRLCGTAPTGIAYPGPSPNCDERVIDFLKKDGRILYGRTIDETLGFSLPTDFYRWNPTCQFRGENLAPTTDKFLQAKPDGEDLLFFVWGHSYEFDLARGAWDKLEWFCKEISAAKDVTSLSCGQFYELFSGRAERKISRTGNNTKAGRGSV